MLLRNVLLPSVLLPVLVTLGVLLVWRLFERRQSAQRSWFPAGAASLSLSFAAAYTAMAGLPRWPPVEATQRLVVFCAFALIASMVGAWLPRGRKIGTLVLLSGCAAWLLESQIRHRWTTGDAVLWVAVAALVGAACAFAWSLSSTPLSAVDERPTRLPVRVLNAAVRPLLLAGLAVCLGLTGSALLGQLAGALAASAATIEAWTLVRARDGAALSPADGLVWALSVGGLLLIGFFYSELPLLPLLLLLGSLFALGAHRASAPMVWKLASLLPLLVAVAVVVEAERDASGGYYDDYQGYDSGA